MPAGEGDIDAPMEAAMAPFRCYVAGVARAQEGALAFAQAAAEMTRGAATLYAQHLQLCLGWSTVAAKVLERPRQSGGLNLSPAAVSLLQEQIARGFTAWLQVADRFEGDPRWTTPSPAPAVPPSETRDEFPIPLPE
jgi:hypothetical protein